MEEISVSMSILVSYHGIS